MDKEKQDKKSEKKGNKRKYVAPKVTRHGSLQGISERVTGVTTACCLTERAKAALARPGRRAALARDVAELVSR